MEKMELTLMLGFVAISNLFLAWCSISNSLTFENDKLIADGFAVDSRELLVQLKALESLEELHLKGFVFDEVNASEFSDAIFKLKIKALTLDQCDINDELVSLLEIPLSLKSIRIERLNLSSKGVKCIVEKLPCSLVSLEILDCTGSESTQQKTELELGRIASLKNIWINCLNNNFNVYQLMLSLNTLALERLKLSVVSLDSFEWDHVLTDWNYNYDAPFFNTLKVFDIYMEKFYSKCIERLISCLFSFLSLEAISLDTTHTLHRISLPPIPKTIKRLLLKCFRNACSDNCIAFNYNNMFISQLTHLFSCGEFDTFPYMLFSLSQLEYLDVHNAVIQKPSIPMLFSSNLKHLIIQASHTIPLLPQFNYSFPMIETLELVAASSDVIDSHLATILTSKNLKCLKIDYSTNYLNYLNFNEKIVSAIEELKLSFVRWKFLTDLFENVQFPNLKMIDLQFIIEGLDLTVVLEVFHPFHQLASLTLDGDFYQNEKELTLNFENLKFFKLVLCQNSLDLDVLLRCMPNLIELQLNGFDLSMMKLKSPKSIRYLTLSNRFEDYDKSITNLIKNTPSLIQLIIGRPFFGLKSAFLASELAYYFKMLKIYFNDELQFDVSPKCIPLLLLEKDPHLLQLVRFKSPKLPDYLGQKLPLGIGKEIVNQLFTLEFGKDIDVNFELIDSDFFSIFQCFKELKVRNLNAANISFLKAVFCDNPNGIGAELIDFSYENYLNLFGVYLERKLKVKLAISHANFIQKFCQGNFQDDILKASYCLESFFTFLSTGNQAIDCKSQINSELFDLFSQSITAKSFATLINKIKNGELRNEEKEQLTLFYSLDFDSLSLKLNFLTPDSFKQFIFHFDNLFFEFEEFVGSIENFSSGWKMFSPVYENCPICLIPYANNECIFFRTNEGKVCHLFHEECLNMWFEYRFNCPYCQAE